ncbi:hypothetical protein BH23VER1_BH23VER1_14010 [soil metagenome]
MRASAVRARGVGRRRNSAAIPRCRRGLWRGLLVLLILLALAVWGAVEWGGRELASPARRPLQDYHREILSDPAAHGLRIVPFSTTDGTPVLVCDPDPSGSLGGRGKLLRQQLADQGLALSPPGTILGNLVLVHGRKGRKEDYLPVAERLCAAGFRCLLPDLPAHGDNPHTTITGGVAERGLPGRVLAEAAGAFAFPPQPAGLLGMSMGGSVAIHAAGEADAPWRALVVVSTFDLYRTVVQHQAASRTGSRIGQLWLVAASASFSRRTGVALGEVAPVRVAPRIRIPTLVAHGSDDPVAPMAAGRRVFDALPGPAPKRWVEVPTAGHDNVLITDFPIYAEIATWMLKHVP